MRFVSYLEGDRPGFGMMKETGIVALADRLGATDLRSLLAGGALELARDFAARTDADTHDVRYLPVIPNPGKVLCIGLNYEGHRVETNSPRTEHPQVFCRFGDSLTAHEDELVRPRGNQAFDYEGELAVVIGRRARRVSEDRALAVVAGYTCFNDGSVRDWQKHTSQFIPGKNFPRTGALGPWLVTSDEVPDPSRLSVETRLNGQVVQRDSTANMLFSVARIVSYCSQFTELRPGDVIATGTPSGVGYRRQPPRYMQPGDVVEVEISGVGVLRNQVREEREAGFS